MLDSILEIIKKATVFMMIGRVILNLGIGKEYEKYTKLVISLMVVLQVWSGMKSVVQTFWVEGIITSKEQFYRTWSEESKKFEKELYEQQYKIEEIWAKEDIDEGENGIEAKEELNNVEEKGRITIKKIQIP